MNEFAAIPTKYKSVQFRSRLEARWAAFFDLLGIEWKYEPIDLDGYIPDFILEGRLLIEVKPALLQRDIDAGWKYKIQRSGWKHDAAILGVNLHVIAYGERFGDDSELEWMSGSFRNYSCDTRGGRSKENFHFLAPETTADYVEDGERVTELGDFGDEKWAEAGNLVRWNKA